MPTGTTPLTETGFRTEVARLASQEAAFGQVVHRWGSPPFWRHPEGFPGLVHGILGQQVSLESAAAAFAKLRQAIDPLTPTAFLGLDDTRLRQIGFSRPKADYARGLADAIASGALDVPALADAPDDEVRSALIALRGIGPWTADVYLLFALRRPDAWPTGDLALAKAAEALWNMTDRPSWDELDAMAERWRPRRAVAARLLWHDYLARRGRSVPD